MDSSGTESESSTAEAVRKARLLHRVPILAHVVKQGLCPEGILLRAMECVTFGDGEYIYCQGQAERGVLFIEEGKVLITQRRRSRAMSTIGSRPVGFIPAVDSSSGVVSSRRPSRRRSQIEAEMEIQLYKHEEFEYFGEESLLQGFVSRILNAVASGAVTCFVLPEAAFARLLAPVHELMLYRHLLQMHGVLAKQRVFQHFSARQRQHILDHCTLEHYDDGARIIQQGDKEDDRYFILADGEADVVLDELLRDLRPDNYVEGSGWLDSEEDEEAGGGIRTWVVCRKTIYQGFGEMGIFGQPRTAHVVAAGSVVCVAISRKTYISACQLIGVGGVDTDAESLFASSLMEEWALVVKTRNLHLANPAVSRYLEMFVKKFKAAYMQKFEGKTLYLDLLRRMHAEPSLADEFPFLSDRVAWDAPTSSLSITRAETRRVLLLPPTERSPFEISFMARLLEPTAFIGKFDRPALMDKLTLARGIARFANFATIQKDKFLFRQGKIESRAFLILRGSINIVNEDVSMMQAGVAVKHYDVLVTLSAGDSFGELSLVTRLHRSASALAPCEADLLVFERAHLHSVMALLPGVSVQHAMVERAEFLATLNFLKDSDFAQCIRVAHDLQEQFYEPRHIFLQEPVHLRTLYIVKSGEVIVFLRQHVPIAEASGTTDLTPTKEVLVRVATIGPQEFFGVAIASANMLAASASVAGAITSTGSPSPPTNTSPSAPSPSPTATSATAAPSPAKAQHYVAATLASVTTNGAASPATTNFDLARTVFMCSTQVQMLELSERGWRRLPMSSLQSIRESVLERHRWNLETVAKQTQQSFFHVDKPWQTVTRPATSSSSPMTRNDNKDPQTRVLEALPATNLARRIKDKKQQQHQKGHENAVSQLFSPGLSSAKPNYPVGRLSVPNIYAERPQSRLSSRGSPLCGVGQSQTPSTSEFAPSPKEKNWASPTSFAPSRLAQLGGSFQPKGAIASTSVAFCAQVPTSKLVTSGLSPRPPSMGSNSAATLSPRQDTQRRNSSLKENTTRSPQRTDCNAMWKLQRRPSVMK